MELSLEFLNSFNKNTLAETLGIKITSYNTGVICGTMPVNARVHQPFGSLHGGASVAFAETLGSLGGNIMASLKGKYCVGMEINANHLKGVKEGMVVGEAKCIHDGNKSQVWSIEIKNDKNQLICISRLTLALMDKKIEN